MAKQKTLRLVLGDQLNERHSWFKKPDNSTTYVLMEIRQETDYVAHHIQKVAAFFAAMQAFASRLRGMGHQVIYLNLDDPQNHQTIAGNVGGLLRKNKFSRFEYLQPDEFRLDLQLRELSESLPVSCEMVENQHGWGLIKGLQ